MLETTTIAGASIALLITLVIQLLKSTFPDLSTRYLPLLTTALGFGFTVLAAFVGGDAPPITVSILANALVAGLASPGIFAAGRALLNPTP